MSTKRPKRPRDPNQLAKLVVDIAVGDAKDRPDLDKEPIAVLGRIGGLKGGRARAEKLSSEQRTKIAKEGAAARWEGKRRADSEKG